MSQIVTMVVFDGEPIFNVFRPKPTSADYIREIEERYLEDGVESHARYLANEYKYVVWHDEDVEKLPSLFMDWFENGVSLEKPICSFGITFVERTKREFYGDELTTTLHFE